MRVGAMHCQRRCDQKGTLEHIFFLASRRLSFDETKLETSPDEVRPSVDQWQLCPMDASRI